MSDYIEPKLRRRAYLEAAAILASDMEVDGGFIER